MVASPALVVDAPRLFFDHKIHMFIACNCAWYHESMEFKEALYLLVRVGI
jgi:hypothetical protein